jgi:hypothetical protein
MSEPLIVIDSTSTPSIAADMMLQLNVRHLLVVDDMNKTDKLASNKPVGIITPLDFARYEEFPNDEVGKDEIEKMLEYYIWGCLQCFSSSYAIRRSMIEISQPAH